MAASLPVSMFRVFAAILSVFILTGQVATAEKYASIVVNMETGDVLHARHADAPRYPASLTKAMTLYMVFDALKAGEMKLYEELPVSATAARQPPSSLRLRSGTTITVRDAIHALITKSANDVAVVVAERLGGSERRFATLMTTKARSMGMTSTTFRNASGLPDTQQLSTARDMAILAERLVADHADYYGYFATQRFHWGRTTYKNHNRLIGDVLGVDGIKTGYTRASGFNLMASAKRNGDRIIAIMFGGSTSRSRDQHVTDLIEAAYASLENSGNAEPGSEPADDNIAFSAIQAPIDPDGAAKPTLNGEVFVRPRTTSPQIAEGDASESAEIRGLSRWDSGLN